MVIMASGITRGRVRTTTTAPTESSNIAARGHIPNNRLPQEPMGSWLPETYSHGLRVLYFFDMGHPCYDQLSPVKTGYPLTSITWPFCGLTFRTHRGHIFFFKLTTCCFSDWIAGSCQVNLFKTEQDCSEAGLKIKSYPKCNFFFYRNVFCYFLLRIW